MKKINVIIEASSDSFGAYADNVEGVIAHADSVSEVKKQVLEAIEIAKTLPNCPEILKEKYEVFYNFAIESLLTYYKPLITLSGMEGYTSIPQKLLQSYSTGAKKPRPDNRKKIIAGLNRLGHELTLLK